MRIDVVTLFPELVQSLAQDGVVGRAIVDERVQLATWNPRDDAKDKHRTVDDRPYGGGPGMVMKVEPLRTTIGRAKAAATEMAGSPVKVSLLSPQGQRLTQDAVRELAQRQRLLLVCGRYEGIDERLVAAEIDEEWSIGDYVLSGGELAAMVMVDAVVRLLPGVLGHEQSAEQDSFVDGLLDCPHYTRPEEFEGHAVPGVLLSGDHGAIERWRLKQALGRTWTRRRDLMEHKELTPDMKKLLDEYLNEYDSEQDEAE
ncbi:MAG: tRNA (guanosine(37)-N1)-methyltransferase TrmD [Gammaproteobacteria bacterium]|nr:MAG: tRNA (guanosine(37)-N1)-methyltransferase TrmD [Gammaproteobacteria bacterium]